MEKEIARIGYIDRFEIYICTDDEERIPHVHIKDGKRNISIKLERNEYIFHNGGKDKLSEDDCILFNRFMISPCKNKRYSTNYEYAVEMWNSNNSNILIEFNSSGGIIIPNYNKIY